jgi:ferredoxin--NADP+ reductase
MSDARAPGEPVLQDVKMHLLRPVEPGVGVVTLNERCTASKKAAGYVRHIEIDVSGTPLVGHCWPGQSLGVIPPGLDAHGKLHKVRLYSLASPLAGCDGAGKVYAITVKRSIDEHWDDHSLFLGVASNYLCDRKPGDRITLTGPAGKRFVLPMDVNKHEYLFFATGTGIAPYRGMLIDLLSMGCTSKITLIMGSPYSTDLIYHEFFLSLAEKHRNFTYLTAISREKTDGQAGMYVQDRLRVNRDQLLPQLASERNLIYICGLAGMELGIFQNLALILQGGALDQYLHVDPAAMSDIRRWDRRMIHKEVRPTRRIMMEVYA